MVAAEQTQRLDPMARKYYILQVTCCAWRATEVKFISGILVDVVESMS
jgi:hypothetical protein